MHVQNTLSDALLDALWRQDHVGVGICGGDGRLERFNPALEEMVGPVLDASGPGDWARDYHIFDRSGLRPLDPDEIPLARAFAGEVLTDVELTTRPPGEPVRHFRCTAAPLLQGPRVTGAVVVVTEVAEHGHDLAATLDAEVERYRWRMGRLQELSARVATIGSHQMRTPLTVIQAHVELLEDDLDDLDVRDDARRTLPAIWRGITALTDAVTALTHANDLANATDPDLQAVDLAEIARRAVVIAHSAHPAHRVHLHEAGDRYVPATADAQWVRRAIVALIEALIEPTGHSDVSLTILDRHDTVGVRVTRPGRARGALEDLMRNMTAPGDSTSDPRALGLALAEAVALAHDGRIDLTVTGNDTSTSASLLLSREPRPHSNTRMGPPGPAMDRS